MQNPTEQRVIQGSPSQLATQYYNKYNDDPTIKTTHSPCTYKQFFRFADRYDLILITIGVLFSLGNGVSLIFYAQPFGKLVDAFAPGKNAQQIVNDTLYSVKLFAFNSIVVFVSSWFMSAAWSITSERQMIKIRKLYFDSLLKQQIAWHDRNRPSQICSKMYIEIQKIHKGMVNNITSILTKLSMGISGIIIALVNGWQMGMVMMAFLPVMMVSGYLSSYFIKQRERYVTKTKSGLDSQVIQVFDCLKTIKMLDGQKYEIDRYIKRLKTIYNQDIKNNIKNKITFAIFFFCILVNYSLGFWYGAKLISDQKINTNTNQPYTVGNVMVVFFTLYLSNLSLSGLPESITNLTISRISMKRIQNIINRKPLIKQGIEQMPQKIQKIIFQNIYFRYDKNLFNQFNLQINPGITALIGQSGSGKTTIINLIMRFYDIFEGRIYFKTEQKQHNINNFCFNSLRNKIGYVGQQPILIGKTIKQVLIAESTPQQQIINLLKKVNAWEFVKQIGLDNQYTMLSGGQKQRIAIARALLKRPQILILDEGTSALDRTNEHEVLSTIKKMKIPFVIMIAHRMETIIHADHIIKLQNGKIIKQGKYNQLNIHEMKQNKIIDNEQQDNQLQSVNKQKQQKKIKQKNLFINLISNHNLSPIQQKKFPQKFKLKYFFQLLYINHCLWYLYLFGSLASVFIGAIFPIFAYLLSNIIVTLSGIKYQPSKLSYYQQKVKILAISLFLISVGGLIMQILRGISFTYLTQNLGFFLKKSAFKVSINKSMVDIERIGAQTLAYIITTNCEDLKQLGGHFIGDILQNLTTILVGLAIAFAFSWQVTLVALGVFPFILLAGKLQMSFSQGMQSNSDKVHKKTLESIIQAIMYIKTVKSLNLHDKLIEKYGESLEEALVLAIKYGNLSGMMFGLGQTLISCLLSLIFFCGALMIQHNIVTVLNLYTAIYAIMFAGVQAGGNMLFVSKLSVAKNAAFHYFENIHRESNQVLQHSICIYNKQYANTFGSEITKKIGGEIELKNIEFRYENRRESILDNFNLHIDVGERLGIVGESGSGKSTIVNILFKIYQICSGEILFDKEDVNQYGISNLRRQLGVVSQQPVLFNRSIYENIKYNCNHVSLHDIVNATKMSKAYDFILQGNFGLKDQQQQYQYQQQQYNTNTNPSVDHFVTKVKPFDQKIMRAFSRRVGTKGSYLSGGQKQRIAIARALIRNPSVIILDEATSALDNENEKMVQEAIDGIKGVTQIIVAHRLSTIENCDRIVMLRKGKIIEEGKYEQLIRMEGHFYKLVNAIKEESEKSSEEQQISVVLLEDDNNKY